MIEYWSPDLRPSMFDEPQFVAFDAPEFVSSPTADASMRARRPRSKAIQGNVSDKMKVDRPVIYGY